MDLAALDRSTRPQDDFYQFANGTWLDTTPIPEIYSGYTVYHQVNEDAELALREIIEAAAAQPGPAGSESQQVGDIYTAWMDIDAIVITSYSIHYTKLYEIMNSEKFFCFQVRTNTSNSILLLRNI